MNQSVMTCHNLTWHDCTARWLVLCRSPNCRYRLQVQYAANGCQQSAISTLRCKVSQLWFPLTEFKVSIHCKYLVAITCSCYMLCATSSPQTRPSNELSRVSRIHFCICSFSNRTPTTLLNLEPSSPCKALVESENFQFDWFMLWTYCILSILNKSWTLFGVFSLCIRACIHYQITNIHRIPILNLDVDWFDSSGLLIPASR